MNTSLSVSTASICHCMHWPVNGQFSKIETKNGT